jgi:hypothetical protein
MAQGNLSFDPVVPALSMEINPSVYEVMDYRLKSPPLILYRIMAEVPVTFVIVHVP